MREIYDSMDCILSVENFDDDAGGGEIDRAEQITLGHVHATQRILSKFI